MADSSGDSSSDSKEFVRLLDVQLHHVGDGFAGDPNVERFGAQARTPAIRAVGITPIAAQKHAHVDFVFLRLHFGEEIVNRLHHHGLLCGPQIPERHIPANLASARSS